MLRYIEGAVKEFQGSKKNLVNVLSKEIVKSSSLQRKLNIKGQTNSK